MYKIATAKITGLIDWVRPDVNKISVAGLEINLKQVDSMNANDLVEVHATLNEAGAWNGRIDMHLPLGHARKIEGNHNKTDDPAAKAATGTPSKPLPDPQARPSAPTSTPPTAAPFTANVHSISRAQRFASRSGTPSAAVPTATAPSSTKASLATSAPSSRPVFSVDDFEQDVPF